MEEEIRSAVFNWLKEQTALRGMTLSWNLLTKGFIHKGAHVTLAGPPGIWKPAAFKIIPLSIRTAFHGPYPDYFDTDGFLVYHYRGSDPEHSHNVGLQEACKSRTPLVYLWAVSKGQYLPIWPVFIIEDHPEDLTCRAAIDPAYLVGGDQAQINLPATERLEMESVLGIRKYVVAYTQRRVHQAAFREAVVLAYSTACALCNLRHRELLDAAHIIPDSKPKGDPIVPNGLCLCKIHHAAFDENLIGLDPGYIIHVREDILVEKDGPMLAHGLQGLHKGRIIVPKKQMNWPDPERLRIRYREFEEAS